MTLLSPTPTLVAPIEIDVPAPAGRSSMLHVDGDRIVWDGRTIVLDRVTAVAYSARRRRRLPGRRTVERQVSIWDGSRRPLMIDLPGGTRTRSFEAEHRAAYVAVTSLVHSVVEPRLRAEILRRLALGQSAVVGTLCLDAHGVTDGSGFSSRWVDLPSGTLEGRDLVITHRVECDRIRHLRVPMTTPNAVLLPELLDEAAAAFS